MTSMDRLQLLENRIKALEEQINRGNFQSEQQFDARVVFKNGFIVENGRILLRSKNNPTGVYIATGSASDEPVRYLNFISLLIPELNGFIRFPA